MSQRVYVTFNANEWKLLTEKSKEFGFSPSQMVLYMVRGELGTLKPRNLRRRDCARKPGKSSQTEPISTAKDRRRAYG